MRSLGFKASGKGSLAGMREATKRGRDENRLGVWGVWCRAPEGRAGCGRALYACQKQSPKLQSEECPDGDGWRRERDPESMRSPGPGCMAKEQLAPVRFLYNNQ